MKDIILTVDIYCTGDTQNVYITKVTNDYVLIMFVWFFINTILFYKNIDLFYGSILWG